MTREQDAEIEELVNGMKPASAATCNYCEYDYCTNRFREGSDLGNPALGCEEVPFYTTDPEETLDVVRDLLRRASLQEQRIQSLLNSFNVIMGLDTPCPLVNVLEKLTEAATHLLVDHNCDVHGYEEIITARDRAKEIVVGMRKTRDDR